MRRSQQFFGLMIVVCVGFASNAGAQDQDAYVRKEFDSHQLTSTWSITAGGNLSTFDSGAAWSPIDHGGVVIDFEEVLGLDEEISTWVLRASYRFNPRHSLMVSSTRVGRTAEKAFDGEVQWGDYVFRANGGIESELDVKMLGFKWMYDLSDSGRLDTGISAGLSTFSISASLAGEAHLEDDTGEEWIDGVAEGADLIAPVPMVGFFLDYAMTPKWVARLHAEVVDLSIGGHDGRVLQTILACEYAFTDVFAIGLDMGNMDIKYSTEKDGDRLRLDFSVKALGAYLSFFF